MLLPKDLHLDIGQSTYISHIDCPLRTALSGNREVWVVNDGRQITAYCHRCKERQWRNLGFVRSADKRSRKSTKYNLEDITTELPKEWYTWLMQFGVTKHIASMMELAYSPVLDRLIIPLKENYEDWIARSNTKTPKYIGKPGRIREPVCFAFKGNQSKATILTEDVFSARNVGFEYQGIALCGTSAKLNMIAPLIICDNLVIWLDGDNAGQSAARKLKRQLEAILPKQIKIYNLSTSLDPKYYSEPQIKEFIEKTIGVTNVH